MTFLKVGFPNLFVFALLCLLARLLVPVFGLVISI
jgi:hypothetical protein